MLNCFESSKETETIFNNLGLFSTWRSFDWKCIWNRLWFQNSYSRLWRNSKEDFFWFDTKRIRNFIFLHNFEISDSFDENIELIPSGSKTRVTRENLQQFIEFAKFKRQNEFFDELKQLKEGFDKKISNKNIEFKSSYNDDRKQQMFWNVIKLFSKRKNAVYSFHFGNSGWIWINKR